MVTPAFGGGQPATGVGNGSPPMSADGEHLIGEALAGFAGTENLEQSGFEYGAYYEFSRNASGWSTEALDPPTSEFPRRVFEFASADLTRSLWEVALPARAGEELGVIGPEADLWNIAVREPAGTGKSRVSVLGPAVAPEHEPAEGTQGFKIWGASADLAQVLLGVKAERKQLWPGDRTVAGGESLYEYRGEGGEEPVLVGVKNSGQLAGDPINAKAELISECGTAYDAVSSGGEIVYFTALAANQGAGLDACNEADEGSGPVVNEVYARINGSETRDISEPTTGASGDCARCSEVVPKPAVFQGASLDGSKVFFTSEQKLLVGAEGDNLYEYDFASTNQHERVTLIAPNVTGVTAVSVDGTRIYFETENKLANASNTNGNGEEAKTEAGNPNLYVYDTALALGSPPVFVGQDAGAGDRTTRDGQFLVFDSIRHFGEAEDTNTVAQLFEYDTETGGIVRVSIGQHAQGVSYECAATKVFEEGFDCNGNTANLEDAPKFTRSGEGVFSRPTEAASHLSVAEDGAVVFASALALTPQAVPGRVIAEKEGRVERRAENVYEYRAGNVYLISPADEAAPLEYANRLLGIDESGRDVFFRTADSLVPQDTDTQSSWYDARQEGGFPAPESAPGCVGAACEGPPAVLPLLPSPGTAAAVGGGNLVAAAPGVAPKALSRARKLAAALRKCAKDRKKTTREQCARQAKARYGRPKRHAASVGRGK